MEEERAKKIEAGREKLAAYKKKKQRRRGKCTPVNSPSHSSDSSTSLGVTPTDLPDNGDKKNEEEASDSSTISEHLQGSSGSVEHDRSLQEIEISNTNFSLILDNLPVDGESYRISQENQPPSPVYSSDKTDTIVADKANTIVNDIQNILNDILKSEQFQSNSDNLDKYDSTDTNDLSINIFEGVSLDDSSINNYVTKLRQTNLSDVNDEEFNKILTPDETHLNSNPSFEKIKELQKQLVRKDSEIAALSAELDSLKELTNSLSTTDYKPYQEEYHSRLAEFQNAVVHRDNLIQQLTESLQQSILNREELQQQSENFAKEISLLQKQLVETSNTIKQHKCGNTHGSENANRSPASSSPSKSVKLSRRKAGRMEDTNAIASVNLQGESVSTPPVTVDLEEECSELKKVLGTNHLSLLDNLKTKINMFVQQKISESGRKFEDDIERLKEKLSIEKNYYETEIDKLKVVLSGVKDGSVELMELKKALDAKHAHEMEDLRTYFEKKCADLEKNYSEDVFSQQSRKMSGSSSSSEMVSNSDIFPSKHPCGPGGDASSSIAIEAQIDPSKLDLSCLTVSDLLKIKDDLTKFSANYEKLNIETLSKGELKKIKTDLANSNLRLLAKYDWTEIRQDVQNKCHAELEILREDYDNRMDLLNVEHDVKTRKMKESYQEQVDALKFELNDALKNAQMSVSTAVQEVASSGEYELAEVVQSYERRLQEQVTLAKIDIIAALEHQIQVLADSDVDSEWPVELLQIRNRFTEKYDRHIEEIKKQQADEIAQMKEEHFKVLNGVLERARRRSLREDDGFTDTDLEIIKDRDNLKKTNSILRHLLGELLVYFTRCEDELNKTLVDEIMRYGFDKDLTQIENELVESSMNSEASKNSDDDALIGVAKRVHFTPNFTDIMNIVDASNSAEIDSKHLSLDLKNELGSCLERLKADANAVLASTTNSSKHPAATDNGPKSIDAQTLSILEEKISSLTRQIITDSQVKNDLAVELEEAKTYVRNLESERVSLENHVGQLVEKQRVLERDLLEANQKIGDLVECGHREIISEGYGQDHRNSSLGGKIASLAELQEKARSLVTEWKNGADHPLIQLVEELCREGERITDEAKKDKEDLRQQVDRPIDTRSSCGVKIEAADRKLRATCCFLEEQAMDREMERDEAQKEIAALKDQLKEREKDRQICELATKEGGIDSPLNACCRNVYVCINSTVEQLEMQMREMTELIEANEQTREEVENERKEAVDKIWVLRDIIRDLEFQIETKNEVEIQLKRIVAELEEVIEQQTKSIDDLNRQLEGCKGDVDAHLLKERIVYLENEAQKLRLNSELVGGEGALKEIQIQLNQFESSIDKKTKDLEGLHATISATSCSSPSEDMSIRDQIQPQTPSVLDECDVPLQQLSRLKEKLVKHSRAEEAAVKRIRDMEMQLTGTKHELEEAQNEKEILQNQVTEQIVLLSSLQMRLDEQRLKAEHNQRQANSSLEVRIYDLENEVQTLKEAIHCKEKTIKQLGKVVEETKERLEDREKELGSKEEDETIVNLRKEIDRLTEENLLLKSKIDSDAQNAQLLPNLVDNIIADKNADIENLRRQLSELQKQYEEYQSLNLDLEQLKQLSQMVTSERALGDILSLMNLTGSRIEQARKVDNLCESMESPVNLVYNRNTSETTLTGNTRKVFFNPEISSIEGEGPYSNAHYTVDGASLIKPNSTEILKSVEKERKVRFDELAELKRVLAEKDDTIKEYREKLDVLSDLERDVEQLKRNLERTEGDLRKATETFDEERKSAKEFEKNLRIELAEKKMHLSEKEKLLELSENDNRRKDDMYMNLAREKRETELKSNELRQDLDHYKNFDAMMDEKNREISRLEEQLGKLIESCVLLEEVQGQLRLREDELRQIKVKCTMLEEDLDGRSRELDDLKSLCRNQSEDNAKLRKELKNKSEQVESLTHELDGVRSEMDQKSKRLTELNSLLVDNREDEIKRLKTLLVDRECELEILNEDVVRYQNEISKLEDDFKGKRGRIEGEIELRFMKAQKEMAEKDLEILKLKTVQDDLNKEIHHLQEHLQEKDRVIEQMKADTKSLHINLETIQNKIRETGNIVDLRKRLQEEQHLNAVLREEVEALKICNEGAERRAERSMSIEDITGQVRKQLDYSARLDSNILQALSSGDDEVNDAGDDLIKERHLNVELERIRCDLQTEVRDLERALDAEREQNVRLRDRLENEKKSSTAVQIEDANLIEQMRIRLEEALDGEKQLEKSVERERKQRIDFENQVTALKHKLTNPSTSSNSKTEATEYKSLPNMEGLEVARLKEEVRYLCDKNEQLTIDFKTLKRTKSELEANLKYVTDMLRLKTDEVGKIESKFDEMRRNEGALREELVRSRNDLEQKLREVENSRELMAELEKERQDTKEKLHSITDKMAQMKEERRIEKLAYQEKDSSLSSTIPDRFLNKMKELTNSLKEQIEENDILTRTLNQMTTERSRLLERIRKLEDQNHYKMPFDDPVSRANHLFGKYLRSESYRKALVWQKRYLIALLATYQHAKPIAEILPLSTFDSKRREVVKSRGKRRFKCAAIALIAIVRMKYMVQRWHSGKRMMAYTQYPTNRNATVDSQNNYYQQHRQNINNNTFSTTQFQVGQPVSSQNFYSPLRPEQEVRRGSPFSGNRPRTPANNEEPLPWSGVTPPQKERLRLNVADIAPSTESVAPLEAPHVLSYFKRFNDIQQRLGMTFDNLNS